MDPLINDILSELKEKHGITRYELERILDSQFKVLEVSIRERELRNINMMHLGKFRPTSWFKGNKYVVLSKKIKRDIARMDPILNPKEDEACGE